MPISTRKTQMEWRNFIENQWIPSSRRLVYEISELTRVFDRKALLTNDQVMLYNKQIESLREKLYELEDLINSIQQRKY